MKVQDGSGGSPRADRRGCARAARSTLWERPAARWLALLPLLWLALAWCRPLFAADTVAVLAYHRFGPAAVDGMTIRTSVFETHLRYLRDHGYQIVPLRSVLEARQPGGKALPPKAVAITVDDGHATVFQYLWPLVKRDPFPVTLFIYPSAISNASYAMTWAQLGELQASGWFDIQSHTYWHPNFKQEKRKLAPDAYLDLVRWQLRKSKHKLEQRSGKPVDVLAWPFGIYDPELMDEAKAAGYAAAFSIDGRLLSGRDESLALPRFLMVDAHDEKAFARLLGGSGK